MSTIRTNAILDASGGTNATINGITPIDATGVLSTFNATGSAPVYACRAWVNFNGTGTVAIRASGNVSSITDNGIGTYTVNFATAMPDANYAFTSGIKSDDSSYFWVVENPQAGTYSASALQIRTATQNGSTTLFGRDTTVLNVAIFR